HRLLALGVPAKDVRHRARPNSAAGRRGAVGAPMRRRARRPIEAPDSAAPNRSGDGAPASPHRRLGSRSYAGGAASSRRPSAITPASTSQPASTASPPAKPSVCSFTSPTRKGPRKPPRFPTELTSAIAPAAALPLAKVAERAQNGPSALHIPNAPSESASSDTTGDITLPLTTSP